MTDEIFKRLDRLAAYFNTTAAKLWDVLIAQARVDMIHSLVWATLSAVVALVSAGLALWCFRTLNKIDHSKFHNDNEGGYIAGILIFTTLSFVCGVSVVCNMNTVIADYLNPSYYALTQLKELFK